MFIIATFVLFTVLVAVISWYKTRDDKLDSQEGYFLASILCYDLFTGCSPLSAWHPCFKSSGAALFSIWRRPLKKPAALRP